MPVADSPAKIAAFSRVLVNRRQRLGVRLNAADSLRNYQPDQVWYDVAFPALLTAATGGSEPLELRVLCFQILSVPKLNSDPAPLLPVFLQCTRSRSPRLRAAATGALARLNVPDARAALRGMLGDVPEVARAARASLIGLLEPEVWALPDWGKAPKAVRGTHAVFLRRAVELAVENVRSGRGGPFGAVIARNGRLVAEGVNLVTAVNDPSAHAEVIAIRAACHFENRLHLDDCILYSSCEPCPMCLGAIHWARVGKLYFSATREDAAEAGFDDSFIYEQVPIAPPARSIPAKRLLAREGRAPLDAWVADTQGIKY